MKNKILYLFLLMLSIYSCKAQSISLNQISQCQAGNCPNYTSVVDSGNLLNKFVGIWKGTSSDGRSYEFRFTKEIAHILYNGGMPWDRLIGRVLIKSSGTPFQEILNTLMTDNHNTYFNGLEFNPSLTKYQMYYSGNSDCNDSGYVYLSFPNPANLNIMQLVFMQQADIIEYCPPGYKTVMPDAEQIILTKQ